jgi:hypothetical protein
MNMYPCKLRVAGQSETRTQHTNNIVHAADRLHILYMHTCMSSLTLVVAAAVASRAKCCCGTNACIRSAQSARFGHCILSVCDMLGAAVLAVLCVAAAVLAQDNIQYDCALCCLLLLSTLAVLLGVLDVVRDMPVLCCTHRFASNLGSQGSDTRQAVSQTVCACVATYFAVVE